MTNWITVKHKQEIRRIFEPKYKRKLSDQEVEEIAINLTSYLETILKLKKTS